VYGAQCYDLETWREPDVMKTVGKLHDICRRLGIARRDPETETTRRLRDSYAGAQLPLWTEKSKPCAQGWSSQYGAS